MAFLTRRENALRSISAAEGHDHDKSPKGSLDAPIADLVNYINSTPQYYTTSCCSGRITLLLEKGTRKGGEWLLASHDPVTYEQVAGVISGYSQRGESSGDVVMRFEPFILAAECSTVADASSIVEVALASGFRKEHIC
jgi:tRNA wybutosine-synthesizing protein 3